MTTKTTISGSGKNLEGMEWTNLLAGYCPKCDQEIEGYFDIYRCRGCGFRISVERFNELCEEMETSGH